MIPLPDEVKTLHKDVVLCADVCHVDGLHFLTLISNNLHFMTIEFLTFLDADHDGCCLSPNQYISHPQLHHHMNVHRSYI